MDWMALAEIVVRAYSPGAFALTLACGLAVLLAERPLYVRRRWQREASIATVVGWAYTVGGTALFVALQWLRSALDLPP